MLYTGWMRVVVRRRPDHDRIVWAIREPQYSRPAYRDHLFVVLSKLLFHFDRIYLHAGAVDHEDRVDLFVGPGGHGKSTLCCRLARSGATILSEDHVLIRRDGARFVLSGCQDTLRLTPKTESAFFDHLQAPTVATSLGPKKEVRLADHFRSRPFVDHEIDRLFFPRLGERLRRRELSARETLLRLIHMTRGFVRPETAFDHESYLEFLGDLAASKSAFELELSPDLRALGGLPELLER